VNSIGESAPSSEVSATPSASITTPTIPVAPTGVSAVAGANQVTVTWNTVSDATSYNVYYSTTTGVTKANGIKRAGVASPDIVTGLAVSTTYYFIVTAVNSAGEGAASTQMTATTNSAVPAVPAAPTGVAATSGGINSATISWTAVSGATSYNIYRGTATGVTTLNGTKVAGVTTPYLDKHLTTTSTFLAANTPYFYIVTAVNSAGESVASSQANATTSVTDGVGLYTTNCSCHGGLATSSKKGKSASTIQAAIDGNTGGMGTVSLKALVAADVAAIATVLGF
jgi:fibronectin type 3 domain-containing protein